MPRVEKIGVSSRSARARGSSNGCSASSAGAIQLYGWDSRSETWHGPNELSRSAVPSKRLLDVLRASPARSWYGPLNCCRVAGEMPTRFFALVHDLSDCAIAMIYCGESKAGPAEILAVVPPAGGAPLREEFAFE